MSLAKLMFARKMKSGFCKILHERKARTSKNIPINKHIIQEEKELSNISQKGIL